MAPAVQHSIATERAPSDPSDFVRTENPPQGICERVTWDGLPGSAGFRPHCYWVQPRPQLYHCPTSGCFWRKHHQMGPPRRLPASTNKLPAPRQEGLDL